jgi:hypothetical protein
VCIVPACLLSFLKLRCTSVLNKLVQVLGNKLLSLRPQQLPHQQQQQQQQQLGYAADDMELSSRRLHYNSVAVIAISKGTAIFKLEF